MPDKDINQLVLELMGEVKTIKSQIRDIFYLLTPQTSNIEFSCCE